MTEQYMTEQYEKRKCPMCGHKRFEDGYLKGKHDVRFVGREQSNQSIFQSIFSGSYQTDVKRCKKCGFLALFSIAEDPLFSGKNSHNEQGVSLAKAGELDEAIQEFTLAIENNPKMGQAYLNRGLVKLKQGILEQSIADFQTAANLFQEQKQMQNYQKAKNLIYKSRSKQ